MSNNCPAKIYIVMNILIGTFQQDHFNEFKLEILKISIIKKYRL
jgi:hypothetical protein